MKFVSTLLLPVGKELYFDYASIHKTRGGVLKVRIQLDLTKKRPSHIWMEFDKKDQTMGKWQAIQYEGIHEYFTYCTHQGHHIHACNVKRRDDEYKKRKE